MAVTGDIDLTLGLDFYRHKKKYKDSSLIPWERKVKEYVKSKVANFTITLNSNSNNSYNYTISNYDILDGYNLTSSSQETNSLNWTYTNSLYNIDDSSIYPSSTINIDFPPSYTSTSISYNNSYYEIKENDKSFHLGDIRPEREITYCSSKCFCCGKHIIGRNISICDNCENITNIFRKSKRFNINNTKTYPYPWDRKPKKDYSGIPWVYHRDRFNHIFPEWSNRKDKLRSIPWLKNLHDRLYNYYVDELRNGELDNSEYLTNMNWIGVSANSGRSTRLMNESNLDVQIANTTNISVV